MKKLYFCFEILHNAPHLIGAIWAISKEDASESFKITPEEENKYEIMLIGETEKARWIK